LLNAATIALDATPKDMWKRSNFPEKSTQKKNMMKKVSTKGAAAERFLVFLRELMSIYQRFPVLKSPQANPRYPEDSAVEILNRSGKEDLFVPGFCEIRLGVNYRNRFNGRQYDSLPIYILSLSGYEM
jgi:hypothetical protein